MYSYLIFFIITGAIACGLFSWFLYRVFGWPLKKAFITTFTVLGLITLFLFFILQYGRLR